MQNIKLLKNDLKSDSVLVKEKEPLALYTTLGVGGKAKLLAKAANSGQLESAVKLASHYNVPCLTLGKGSNVIISDAGFDGLVIINNSNNWEIMGQTSASPVSLKLAGRFDPVNREAYSESDLDYSDEDAGGVLVRADSGIKINVLMNDLFKQGITGLQWFAGIPATVGGAVYTNMHGGRNYFSEIVEKARLTDGKVIKEVNQSYFKFDYDWSILHQTKEIILWVDLRLKKGNVNKAKKLAKEWARQKSFQPQRSAGCIFQNLSEEERKRLNLPTSSVGYLIDRVLNLKGVKKGGAVISLSHAAFIENSGNARAADVIELINLIKEKAKTQLGIDLKTEVELIGNMQ